MNITCPNCEHARPVAEKYYGRKVKCPRCQVAFRVCTPLDEEKVKLPVNEVNELSVARIPFFSKRNTGPIMILAGISLGFLVVGFSPEGSMMGLLAYVAIILIGVGFAIDQTGRRKILVFVATAIFFLVWARFDYRIRRYENDTIEAIETVRWGTVTHEHTIWKDGSLETRGPIAGTGRKHGKWTFYNRKSSHLFYQFYWYGDEVSEGEWHRLNK